MDVDRETNGRIDLFSDYLEIITAVVVPCDGHKIFLYIDIVLLFSHVLDFWDCRVLHLNLGTEMRSTRG